MRLIDADELLQDIKENMPNYEVKGELLNYVNEQPTAYDISKVVAELEETKGEIALNEDELNIYFCIVFFLQNIMF